MRFPAGVESDALAMRSTQRESAVSVGVRVPAIWKAHFWKLAPLNPRVSRSVLGIGTVGEQDALQISPVGRFTGERLVGHGFGCVRLRTQQPKNYVGHGCRTSLETGDLARL